MSTAQWFATTIAAGVIGIVIGVVTALLGIAGAQRKDQSREPWESINIDQDML